MKKLAYIAAIALYAMFSVPGSAHAQASNPLILINTPFSLTTAQFNALYSSEETVANLWVNAFNGAPGLTGGWNAADAPDVEKLIVAEDGIWNFLLTQIGSSGNGNVFPRLEVQMIINGLILLHRELLTIPANTVSSPSQFAFINQQLLAISNSYGNLAQYYADAGLPQMTAPITLDLNSLGSLTYTYQ